MDIHNNKLREQSAKYTREPRPEAWDRLSYRIDGRKDQNPVNTVNTWQIALRVAAVFIMLAGTMFWFIGTGGDKMIPYSASQSEPFSIETLNPVKDAMYDNANILSLREAYRTMKIRANG